MLIADFNPAAFSIGPVKFHWYGIMYACAFAQFRYLALRRASKLALTESQIDSLLFYGIAGAVAGGRLGEALFYQPLHFLANPAEIFAIWRGGMSFHGGFAGVCCAVFLWSRKQSVALPDAADFIAPLVPLGLAFGRIGNFINGELWGRMADPALPWAMAFPRSGDLLARHPSQLYQACLEGLLLFALLYAYSAKSRPRLSVFGAFLAGYGALRFAAEYFREPDAGIFGFSYAVSMGQWLCLPMILAGAGILAYNALRKAPAGAEAAG